MSWIIYWQRAVMPYLRAQLGQGDRGSALVEYVLLLMLIAVVCILSISVLGEGFNETYSEVGESVRVAGQP